MPKGYGKGSKVYFHKGSFKKGNTPWNKGKSGLCVSLRKGKKYPQILGEKHGIWKGDRVGYACLHKWVIYHLGQPGTCEHCGKDGLTRNKIHWANKSHQYKRDLTDWIRLCVSCHMRYDRSNQCVI